MPPKIPKPKRKGKKKKGKPLTEEEKLKQQAQKALAEREKIARRQKLTKAFLDIKKDKEYELLKVNNNKILDLWRPILRKQKIKELLEDYKLMQLTFQRTFDKKNSCIEEMEKNLEKNEGEYDTAVDMHLHNIDKMMEFYYNRLAEVKESFTSQRNKLIDSLNAEKQFIQDQHEKSLQQLRDNMSSIERGFKEDAHEAKVELYMKEEDLKNSVSQEVHAFKMMMEQKISSLWENIHKRILGYEQTSNDKRKEYSKLKERDEVLSAIIDGQFHKLNTLKDGISKVNGRILLFNKAFGKYIDELKAKKQESRAIYNELISRQKYLVTNAKDHIQHLALTSYTIIQKMNEMLKQRERILRAIERCRKEERMEEKVDPFLKRWGIKPITIKAIVHAGESEQFDGFADESESPGQKYNLHVPHIEHALDCDCNPCTCMKVHHQPETGGVSEVHLRSHKNKHKHKFGAGFGIGIEEYENEDNEDDEDSESESETDSDLIIDLEKPKPSASNEKAMHKIINEFTMLEIFWTRYNKVTLEKESLKQRRRALIEDNHNLRLTLRNYMGSLNPIGLDLVKFTNELTAKDKSYFQKCMKRVELELKRKERCRKVGGVRVH